MHSRILSSSSSKAGESMICPMMLIFLMQQPFEIESRSAARYLQFTKQWVRDTVTSICKWDYWRISRNGRFRIPVVYHPWILWIDSCVMDGRTTSNNLQFYKETCDSLRWSFPSFLHRSQTTESTISDSAHLFADVEKNGGKLCEEDECRHLHGKKLATLPRESYEINELW